RTSCRASPCTPSARSRTSTLRPAVLTMPTISSTTRVSIRENPRCTASVPIAYVRVGPFASRPAVRPQREHIDLAAYAGLQVLVRIAPGVLRQAVHVGTPVAGFRRLGGPFMQGGQP